MPPRRDERLRPLPCEAEAAADDPPPPPLPGLREEERGGGRGGDGMPVDDEGRLLDDPRLTAIMFCLRWFGKADCLKSVGELKEGGDRGWGRGD